MPFWIKTPTHPCTSHPLHSLEHYINFHDLPFSLLSSLVSSQYLQNFWWFGWHRAWAGGRYANVGEVTISDPDCNVTVGVMFWFTYFSVDCCIRKIYIGRRKQWCLRLMVCHFHVQKLLLFNYAKVNTVSHTIAPLKHCQTSFSSLPVKKGKNIVMTKLSNAFQ